jgi:hypothetical protein
LPRGAIPPRGSRIRKPAQVDVTTCAGSRNPKISALALLGRAASQSGSKAIVGGLQATVDFVDIGNLRAVDLIQ